VAPDLLRAAKHGKGAPARVAAADALAVCCFVMSDDERSTRATMDDLRSLWANPDAGAGLRAAALRGWTFLFTSLSSLPNAAAVEALLPALAALLHDGDVEVRAAAGEAIAVVYHTCGLDELEAVLEEEVEEEEEEEEEEEAEEKEAEEEAEPAAAAAAADGLVITTAAGAAAAKAGSAGGGSEDSLSGLSEVVGRMRDLATNRGDRQRRSKRDRASLRGAFREITRVIEVRGSVF